MGAAEPARLSHAADAAPGAPRWLAEFDWFLDSLRQVHGFRIGIGEQLRALRLVESLRARGVALEDAEVAAGWLAPVLATSPAEQQRFRALFVEFARLDATGGVVATPAREVVPPPPWWRRIDVLLIALAVIALLALALLLLQGWRGGELTPAAPTPGAPSVRLTADWIAALGRALGIDGALLERAALFALPFLPAAAFIAWRRRRADMLARGAAPRDLRPQRLEFDLAATPLFAQASLPPALQALRRHRRVPGAAFDAEATLRATLAAGGRVEFRRGTRRQLVEYVLLVEREGALDHRARLADLVVDRLAREQVRVARYDFHRAPLRLRRVSEEGGAGEVIDLGDLAARHHGQVALLVASADLLVDDAGQVAAWLEELQELAPLTLLTPDPPSRWGDAERRLVERGVVLLPAVPAGLRLLGELIRGGSDFAPPEIARGRAGDGRIDIDDPRWLLDASPAPAEIAAVIGAIDMRLPPAARELLACLAALPVIDPALTLYLGARLADSRGVMLLDETGFGALAGLPWLRHSRMPDWLRAALVTRLGDRRLAELGTEFQSLLQRRLSRPDGKLTLEIALKPGAEWLDALRRWIRSDPGSPLRDVIFLSVLRGERPPPLAVAAPRDIARLLRRAPDREEKLVLVLAGALGVLGAWFPAMAARALDAAWDVFAGRVFERVAPVIAALLAPYAAVVEGIAAYSALCALAGVLVVASGGGGIGHVYLRRATTIFAAVAALAAFVLIAVFPAEGMPLRRFGAAAMAAIATLCAVGAGSVGPPSAARDPRAFVALFTGPSIGAGLILTTLLALTIGAFLAPPLALLPTVMLFDPEYERTAHAMTWMFGSAGVWGLAASAVLWLLMGAATQLTESDRQRLNRGLLVGAAMGIATSLFVFGLGLPVLVCLPRLGAILGIAVALRYSGFDLRLSGLVLPALVTVGIELPLRLAGTAISDLLWQGGLIALSALAMPVEGMLIVRAATALGAPLRAARLAAAAIFATAPLIFVTLLFVLLYGYGTGRWPEGVGLPFLAPGAELVTLHWAWSMATLPAIPLAWLILRRGMLQVELPARGDAVRRARDPLLAIVVLACWLMALRVPLNPGPWQPLLIVAALWFARRAPAEAEYRTLLAGWPMMLSLQYGGLGTEGNPAMVLAAWMVARLASDRTAFESTLAATRLSWNARALLGLGLVGAALLALHATAELALWLRFSGPVYLAMAMLIAGWSRLDRRELLVFAPAAGLGVAFALAGDSTRVLDLALGPFRFGGDFDGLRAAVTALLAFACGRWIRLALREDSDETVDSSGRARVIGVGAVALLAASLALLAAPSGRVMPQGAALAASPAIYALAFALGFVLQRLGLSAAIVAGVLAAGLAMVVEEEVRVIMTAVVRGVVVTGFAFAGAQVGQARARNDITAARASRVAA